MITRKEIRFIVYADVYFGEELISTYNIGDLLSDVCNRYECKCSDNYLAELRQRVERSFTGMISDGYEFRLRQTTKQVDVNYLLFDIDI